MKELELQTYLLGGWRLINWRIEYSDGHISYPFGDDAIGQILYTDDGSMSATVCAAKRNQLDAASVRDAPIADQAKAFRSYFHYAGRWWIDDESVVHEVELGLNPGFPGTHQVRRVDVVDDNRMILSAQEDHAQGNSRKHALEWQRNR